MTQSRHVLIAGGIGGLAAALTLHQIGVPCTVFESVRDLKPLGVGSDLQPNAVPIGAEAFIRLCAHRYPDQPPIHWGDALRAYDDALCEPISEVVLRTTVAPGRSAC